MARNPLYVDRGGEQAIRHPIALSGATLQGFVLDAELSALSALIDRQLNVPAAGAVRYLPLAPRVMLIYASMARAQSMDARDRELGWTTEIDVGFWVPMLCLGDGLPKLTWYIEVSSHQPGRLKQAPSTQKPLHWLLAVHGRAVQLPEVQRKLGEAQSASTRHEVSAHR